MGAAVKPDPHGRVEVGYYPIEPTPEGEALIHWPRMVYQWHRDGFELPSGATRLAGADGPFPEQAFLAGSSAFGLQFHPELTFAMTYRWTVKGAERLKQPGAQTRREPILRAACSMMRRWMPGSMRFWICGLRRANRSSCP
jgi:GMP synthase (glutamine-hydrolysing)